MQRERWNTNFRKDLRKGVKQLAVELDVEPNHILEIGFEYLQNELKKENGQAEFDVKEIINNKYKEK